MSPGRSRQRDPQTRQRCSRPTSRPDSTTAGPADLSYPDFLPELLDQPADAIANEGIGGEDTGEGLNRLQELLDLGPYPNSNTMLYCQVGHVLRRFPQSH